VTSASLQAHCQASCCNACAQKNPLVVDPANASRTLLYDTATLDWSGALLQAFDIPVDVLPRCVGTQHAFARSYWVGRRAVPLRACSGDQSAALFALLLACDDDGVCTTQAPGPLCSGCCVVAGSPLLVCCRASCMQTRIPLRTRPAVTKAP
jgi:hypothetical protein